MSRYFCVCAAMAVIFCGSRVDAAIRITEWMYQGAPAPAVPPEVAEFVELTNVGNTAIDMTGWSFDDSSDTPGTFSLSLFGVVQPGESVVLTDWDAELFRTAWNLPALTKIIGSSTEGLGRADEINIFEAGNALVDQLTYGDVPFPGSLRTQAFSGNIPGGALGANDVIAAVKSESGDGFGSYQNARGEWGNPGAYPTVPEPTSIALATGAMAAMLLIRRRS